MIWAESKLRAEQCFRTRGDVGGLVGTAFVVRDIVKISEAVGDELINYFGEFLVLVSFRVFIFK